MKVLVSKLEEQSKQNDYLSAKIDALSQKDFRFDDNTTKDVIGLKNALKDISIPEEVRVIKAMEFSHITGRVLLWFFLISIPIVGISLYIGLSGYNYKSEILKEDSRIETSRGMVNVEQIEWLINYSEAMKEKNPNTHKAYIEKKPIP